MIDASSLRPHGIVLRGDGVVLRPLTERDWPRLLRWNQNAEVLRWVESPDNPPYDLTQVQRVYRAVSQSAFCFMIKSCGREVGECWLQRMNVRHILRAYPGVDCRRIDIMIGEPHFWGRGIGSEAIRLLVRFGFEREGADLIFAFVAAENARSFNAFRNAGFREPAVVEGKEAGRGVRTYELVISRPETP